MVRRCRLCSYSGTKRAMINVNRDLEFPKDSGTNYPFKGNITVCGPCYKPIKTWLFLKADWDAEELKIPILRVA